MLKRNSKVSAFSICLALITSVSCSADMITESSNFANGDLLDNAPAAVDVITITDQGIIEDISITIQGINHTSVGDLTAELRFTSLGGGMTDPVALLFFRPNFIPPNGIGSRANLDGDYTFTTDEADESFWSESAIPDDETVDSSIDYFASDENGNYHDIAGPQFFGGFNVQGAWTLVIDDVEDAGNNEGAVTGWTIEFNVSPIPEPGCGAMVLLLGLISIRRRRQNR